MANNFNYNALGLLQRKLERRKSHLGIMEFDDKTIPGLFTNEVLQAAITAFSIDGRGVEEVTTHHLNGIIKEASGPAPLDDITVTFNDYNEAAVGAEALFPVRRFLEQWFNMVFDEGLGTSQAPAAYKSRATLLMLDGNQRVDASYELIGIWPKKRPNVNIDHSNRDGVTIEVPFSVDFMRYDDTSVHILM